MKWKEKAIAALKDSIAHWDRLASGTRHPHEHTGVKDCACCQQWFDCGRCIGCPIKVRTGLGKCHNTPYDAAEKILGGYHTSEFYEAADVMRDYLIETLAMVRDGRVKP